MQWCLRHSRLGQHPPKLSLTSTAGECCRTQAVPPSGISYRGGSTLAWLTTSSFPHRHLLFGPPHDGAYHSDADGVDAHHDINSYVGRTGVVSLFSALLSPSFLPCNKIDRCWNYACLSLPVIPKGSSSLTSFRHGPRSTPEISRENLCRFPPRTITIYRRDRSLEGGSPRCRRRSSVDRGAL